MRKSVIAFGILCSVLFNTVSANTNPIDRKTRTVNTTSKNVAPLSLAVVENDYQTVKRFLELGSDIEVKEKIMGMTPVMYAARYNNVKLLQLLIDNGASLKEESKFGWTALKYAKISKATEAIAFLEAL